MRPQPLVVQNSATTRNCVDTGEERAYPSLMRNTFRAVLSFALSGALFLPGCAVQKSKAPQIASSTADALNFATLISSSQKDYVNFFEDVGAFQKQGALSADEVATLNSIGSKMRDLLDVAGNLAQTYAATKDAGVANQISAFLQQAAQIYAQLYATRSAMLSTNAAQKAAGSGAKN